MLSFEQTGSSGWMEGEQSRLLALTMQFAENAVEEASAPCASIRVHSSTKVSFIVTRYSVMLSPEMVTFWS
jgi:hypothetical protein